MEKEMLPDIRFVLNTEEYDGNHLGFVQPYADCEAVMDTKRDFEKTFAKCKEVTEYYTEGRGAVMRLEHMLLRLAAPLM